jgi:import receptor subunit TOM20
VAVLDPDLEGAGTHCSHCLRAVDAGLALPAPAGDPLGSVYCSRECEGKARAQYHTLLFAPGPALPAELQDADGVPPEARAELDAARSAAQARFAAFLAAGDARARTVPHLLARFIGRQVGLETAKMMPGGGAGGAAGADLPPVDERSGLEYSLWDHVERLRFLDVVVPADEQAVMRELLQTALPGLEGFLNDERHAVLKGKIMYNAIGVALPPLANAMSTDDLVSLVAVLSPCL